jgi:hypothetical protein
MEQLGLALDTSPSARRPCGRPVSEVRLAIMSVLPSEGSGEPMTSEEVRRVLPIATAADRVMWALNNLVRAGLVARVDTCRRPGVKRPVPRYAIAAGRPAAAPDEPSGLDVLDAAWRGGLFGRATQDRCG